MLKFCDVTFLYEEENYMMFENLNFSIENGKFISLIGASGCGKSTVFRLINGIEKPRSGSIFVDGENIENLKNYCAFMPQKDLLFPWRTIEKNLMLPLEIQGVKKEEAMEHAAKALEQVGLLQHLKSYPKILSGGMKQRVSFARTILAGGNLMLLDEPFSALDSLTRIEMQKWLIEQWRKLNKTILFITHDVEEAIFLSNEIYVMQGSPVKELKKIEIPLLYPRDRRDLKRPDIAELKESLISMLSKEEG